MNVSQTISFFTPSILVVEILLGEFLFVKTAPKRQYFWVIFLLCGFTSIYITIFTEITYSSIMQQWFTYGDSINNDQSIGKSLFNFFFYLIIFLMTILTVFLSYKIKFTQALFLCSGGYALQHIARSITRLCTIHDYFTEDPFGPYMSLILEFLIFAAVYLLFYFILIKKFSNDIERNADNLRKAITAFIVTIVCIGMSRITIDIPEQQTLISIISNSVYAILCCGLIISTIFDIKKNENMAQEVDMMAEILRNERKQYELSKENIELINIKCHDLKHQIASLRKDGSEKNIQEIEHAIMIYDSAIKTGNDELDVLLTQKKLICDSRQIQLTCVVNGKLVSFMDNFDVYSLFGNAISNAIESVENIEDKGKRCVNVIARKIADMLIIHVENYFQGDLKLKDGLPVTSKDPNYHGFGMLSMKRIAKKYGGELTVSLKEDIFNLDIIIPFKKENAEKATA